MMNEKWGPGRDWVWGFGEVGYQLFKGLGVLASKVWAFRIYLGVE